MEYLIVFGNTPLLSRAEFDSLDALLEQSLVVTETLPEGIVVSGEVPPGWFEQFGGIVKVAEVVGTLDDEKYLDIFPQGKFTFGFSSYVPQIKLREIRTLTGELKEVLQQKGNTVRYVLPQEGPTLSSVVVTKQKVVELVLFPGNNDQIFVGKTIFVSDFEGWNKRDYGRPAVDPHAGMLPPRVARMMVNLARPARDFKGFGTDLTDPVLLDPFCGVGTILSEAMLLGWKVVGSDIEEKQVEASKANLEWLKSNFDLRISNYELWNYDAKTISAKLQEKVDAIVTEPDLGPNSGRITGDVLRVTGRLEQLYTESLKDWAKTLKPGGKVVIALPSFKIGWDRFNASLVKNVLDKASAMGYSLLAGPIEYHRPQAQVIRNLCVLQLQITN